MKHLSIIAFFLCSYFFGFSQNQWDIRFSQSSLSCMTNQVCYQVEVQNTTGTNWALGDQNYRFFFDGDFMTVISVTSLLPNSVYGAANIDQNIKISGAGQEAASPLDDIDDNLGFLDFSIVQNDKTNPSGAQQLMAGVYTSVAEICMDVDAAVLNDNTGSNCLGFYHSRPATAGAITNQYTVVSENNAPGSTIAAVGVNYDDLNATDGDMSCLGNVCAPPPMDENEWDIQLTLNTSNCNTNQACYTLQVQNTSGANWALGDQNYRLFFDGDLMTVTSVTSLLPNSHYANAVIDMNTKYSGTGQEAASPLDDIDDNLGFLDFNIIQTDKTNPTTAFQLMAGSFTSVAEICVDVDASVYNDQMGNTCLSFYHSRPSTAGTFTSQYTTISENDAANSTTSTNGVNYNDLMSMDGASACLGINCAPERQWGIQLSRSSFDCDLGQVCYQLEVQNTAGTDWTLGDQNYRLFFDGDLMTVTSVTSLLPSSHYANAVIDMNTKYSGSGQEAASPLDDIDDNLGFLDFNIIQTDKTNPNAANQLMAGMFTPVAEICVDVDAAVLNDQSGANCVAFYHSRFATAGTFTNQFTTISENDAPNSTVMTMGANYDDLNDMDGADACLGLDVPVCNIMGMSVVMENQQNEMFSGPMGVASYAWSVISGDAVVDGVSNTQNVIVDFGTMNSTLQLITAYASGCMRTCTYDVTVAGIESQWGIQLTQSNLNCVTRQVCYQLEVQNTTGDDWTIADQNYRLFFDGDLMTVTSVTSLLPTSHYANAVIDMNTKYMGQGQEAVSPLDDIDNNLGFLDFNITQTDKTNPTAATQLMAGMFTPVAEVCVDVSPTVFDDMTGSTCLAFYHSRPSTAGTFTSQYTTISENDAPNSTVMTMGATYDDLTSADGANACLGLNAPTCNIFGNTTVDANTMSEIYGAPGGMTTYQWAVTSGDATITSASDGQNVSVNFGITDATIEVTITNASGCAITCSQVITVNPSERQWDIRLTQSSLDCNASQVCYQLEVQNTTGDDWTIADQNYRLFFDGDLMTVTSVTSLLPASHYANAVIDMNTKYMGQGQESASPLDDIDDHLGFLDFNIIQTDKSNPNSATQITTSTFTSVAEICVQLDETELNNSMTNSCVTFYHSRSSTAGTFTNQYTTISENDAPNNTVTTVGANYDDLTSDDGANACLNTLLPNDDLVVSDTTVCNFTNAMVFVYATEVGVNYTLRDDNTNSIVGGPTAGTGNAVSFTLMDLNPIDTYNYTVIANSTTNNCSVELTDQAVIIVEDCDFEDFEPICELPPCHFVSADIYLGQGVSGEMGGAGNSNADTDDDDGVLIPNDIRRNVTIRFPTTIYNNTGNIAYLTVWVDWNGDQDFEDAGEQIAMNSYDPAMFSGEFTDHIETTVPASVVQGLNIAVRFRLSTDDLAIQSPCGELICATDGEIEDYIFQVACPPRICLPVGVTIIRGQ